MRSIIALSVGAAILLGLSSQARAQRAQDDTIIEIRVEGNQRLSKEAILANVKLRTGQEYDEATVQADLKRLLATKQFKSAAVERTDTPEGVIVTFKVIELPGVAKVVFVGNRAFTAEELAKELPFGAGDALSEGSVRDGQDAVAAKYRDAGYHDVRVEYDKKLMETRREVIYRIREGARAYVSEVLFEGNERFRDIWLRQQIGTAKRRWPFFPGKLDMDQLQRDVAKVRQKYVDDGFLAVEVDRLVEFSPDKKKATVKFVIKEGPQFRVARVLFKGNEVFSDEQLGRRLALSSDAIFTPLKLDRDVRALRSTYGELGYIYVEVSGRKIFRAEPGLVDVEFTISEGQQYLVGRIDIRGNKITQSRVIRRVLKFFPDQRFDTEAMEESERRLMETRLFNRVTIQPLGPPEPEAPKVRDVLVQVEEGRTANFLVGAGVSSDYGLIGNVSLIEHNFDITRWPGSFSEMFSGRAWRGAGQRFKISAEPGTELMRFYVDWREPYLFDRPYVLGVQAFLFDRERETYDERRYGGAVSLGYRFKNRWYGEVATRIEGVRVEDLESDAPPEVIQDKGSHALFGFKGSLTRDNTDSLWRPTRGDRLQVSYEQVTGDFNFGRIDARYNYYRTVHVDAMDRKHVLKARVAGGHICGSAPVFEKYYGGGTTWIRGFEFRGISPRSLGTNEQIGGDFILFAGTEYEFPIIGARSANQVRGVVFLDTGTVEEDFTITTYRASVGFGVRWYVQFIGPVPISLDIGIPISKDGDDDEQIFNFTIGWSF